MVWARSLNGASTVHVDVSASMLAVAHTEDNAEIVGAVRDALTELEVSLRPALSAALATLRDVDLEGAEDKCVCGNWARWWGRPI